MRRIFPRLILQHEFSLGALLYLPPDLHVVGIGGALSAVRAQCNYLGVWPY